MWEKIREILELKNIEDNLDKFAKFQGKYKGYLYKILRKIDLIEMETVF